MPAQANPTSLQQQPSQQSLQQPSQTSYQQPEIDCYRNAGAISLKRWGGYISEEFLPELQGSRGVKVLTEMLNNDAVIGALMLAITQLIRRANWHIEGEDNDERVQFLTECKDDMKSTWEEFISDVCSMFGYGWDVHEMSFKMRKGMEPGVVTDTITGRPYQLPISKYNDNKIGWANFSPRKQESLSRWIFAGEPEADKLGLLGEEGEAVAMVQAPYPNISERKVPLIKCLHFKTESAMGNPEGKPITRNMYRSWYFRKNFEVIMGIGVERDLAGFPVLYIPYNDPFWHEDHPDHQKSVTLYEGIIKKMRRDENDGLILPSLPNTPECAQWKIELLSTGSRRPVDIKEQLIYYDNLIANGALAQFILLGTENVGSFALGVSKQELFQMAINGWMNYIAAEINRKAVPLTLKLNGMSLENMPQFKADPIEVPNLKELGEYVSGLANSGAITLDRSLEDHLRARAKLPEKAGDEEEDNGGKLTPEEEKALEIELEQEAKRKAAEKAAADKLKQDELMSQVEKIQKMLEGKLEEAA